jgi:transposase InsO family protein
MPWDAMSTQDLRFEFVVEASREGANVRQLCRRFGVSPKTGYKWLERFRAAGKPGLADRGRRPLSCPRRSEAEIETAALAVRKAHPAWGGRKIRRVLAEQGVASPPAPSTITAILRRNGVALGQFGGGAAAFQRFEREAPNDLWQMDFKGHVGLARGGRLHPLTVIDDHSRFAVVLKACADQRTETVQAALVEAFRRYGLPGTLITDNGSPWGDGPGSPFTPLGVFLIDQGVRIAHSRPYHPQTMGKDERFHRTLKAEALSDPPFADLAEAASRLERWRAIYNNERPHEALGLETPATRYRASPRDYREAVEPPEYAPDDRVRKVQQNGWISFQGRSIRLPKAFRGCAVALRPTERDGVFEVYYRRQFIAALDFQTENGDPQPVTHVSEQVSPISPV